MIRAFYTAASGMVAQSIKQDITANNIANAQTPGFKRDRLVTASFSEALRNEFITRKHSEGLNYPDSPVTPSLVQAQAAQDSSPGVVKATGGEFDFAIDGEGAFEVMTPSGTQLTRAGNFRLGADGKLLTADGGEVQGRSGAIRLPKGEFGVAEDGRIIANGAEIDRIKVVGDSTGSARVVQGSLEMANVNIVSEMVHMIANMRAFEANQKVIASIDQGLEKLINEAGKI